MSKGKEVSVGLRATCTDNSITIHADKQIYTVWRKSPDAAEWGPAIKQRLIGLDFHDPIIVPGTPYEYKIQDFNGATGYICAGSKIPLVDNRWKLVLIVESTHAAALAVELERFESDLVGSGYTVLRHDILNSFTPDYIRELIRVEWNEDKENVKTVVLFGAVPVPRSGDFTYDGHDGRDGGPSHKGAQSADSYYGSMTGTWTDETVNNTSAERPENWNVPGDGKFDNSIIPAPMEISVGRIDFSNLTCFSNKVPPRSELDLLRSYLARNHAYRRGEMNVPRRAVICDGFSDRPFSGAAWRMFPTCVGSENITEIPLNTYFT